MCERCHNWEHFACWVEWSTNKDKPRWASQKATCNTSGAETDDDRWTLFPSHLLWNPYFKAPCRNAPWLNFVHMHTQNKDLGHLSGSETSAHMNCGLTSPPRPSHHTAFDCLQYAKTGEGGPSPFYHVNEVSVYLGRQRRGGVPDQKNDLEVLSCSFYPKYSIFECSRSKNAPGSK